MTDIRIITWNIHKGFNFGNTRFVLHQIREMLHNVNADIVFLQEIHGSQKKHEKIEKQLCTMY